MSENTVREADVIEELALSHLGPCWFRTFLASGLRNPSTTEATPRFDLCSGPASAPQKGGL